MRTPSYLFQSDDLDGPMNMALDEVLWTEASAGTPFVRLYGWANRPVLSLGYFQCADEVRRDPRLRELPFVRRLTGGGAIVHDQEITYSLALPAPLAPPTKILYELVHRAIAFALLQLGIPATVAGETVPGDQSSGLCFCRNDALAVRVHGIKVLGSAQRRRPESILMHGSLVLARSSATPAVLGLREILGAACSGESMHRILRGAITAALDLELQPSELPSHLRLRAIALTGSKYRTTAWNERSTDPDNTLHEIAKPELRGPVNHLVDRPNLLR